MKRNTVPSKACLGFAGGLLGIAASWSQSSNLVAVVSKPISGTIELPGEFQPYQSISIHTKLRGYVSRVLVIKEVRSNADSFSLS